LALYRTASDSVFCSNEISSKIFVWIKTILKLVYNKFDCFTFVILHQHQLFDCSNVTNRRICYCFSFATFHQMTVRLFQFCYHCLTVLLLWYYININCLTVQMWQIVNFFTISVLRHFIKWLFDCFNFVITDWLFYFCDIIATVWLFDCFKFVITVWLLRQIIKFVTASILWHFIKWLFDCFNFVTFVS
jgi:hypothetical protein